MTPRYLALKLGRAVFTLWLVVTFVFVVLRLTGDPAEQLLPDDIAPETVEYYRALWGLDRPLWEQYVGYLKSLAQGDFGISFRNNLPAIDLVLERVPATLQLMLTAFFVSMAIGIPCGIYAALHRDTAFDRTLMTAAVFGYSLPNFFLGIVLILIFSLTLRWLPSSGSDTLWHMVMPVVAYGTAFAGQVARFSRSAMLDVTGRAYMRTAHAKGASRPRRVYLHALPNAAIPIVTIVGLKLGEVIGGAVITENVFAWPGVGRLLTTAVANRDLAVVQCIVILIALTMVIANFIVDLAYGWLDPRIRVGAATGAR